MSKVVDLKAAKQAAEKKKYADSVLSVFDRLQHEQKRQQKEAAAEVRRKARNQV